MIPTLLLVAACARTGPAPATLEEPPRLVAPEGAVYAVRPGAPRDPAVAAAAGGAAWEESLSGAASGLALALLDGDRPDAWRTRWAALAAGYPYPVVAVEVDECALGCPGSGVMDALRPRLRPGDDLGLARARGPAGDVWVGLVGRHALTLSDVPRQAARGAEIVLAATGGPAAPGVAVALVSPEGDVESAYLAEGVAVTLDVAGAWWIQVGSAAGVAAAFPVYVDVEPPRATPLDDPPSRPATADEAVAATWRLLDGARADLGRNPFGRDAILEAAARAHLRDRLGQTAVPLSGPLAGPGDACRAALACAPDAGPDACVRRWLVDAGYRAHLADPRCALAGVAAARSGDLWAVQVELGAR